MAINSLSTGFRPGVCTSSTRPTAPYEGQVIYETDTDLSYVWGGAAWQQVSGGTAVGNSGLVVVKSQTVGSSVSSVTVSNAFNATYENYLISYSGGTKSTDTNISMQFGSSATSYYSVLSYGSFAGGAISNSASNNDTQFNFVGGGNSSVANIHATIRQPFLTKPTEVYAPVRYGTVYGNFVGYHGELTSYSAFTITAPSGTFTGGTIVVYGYRQG
jgi:hypothetical protein